MTELEALGLGGTQITDVGLICLEGFTKLKGLLLADTMVTGAGVAKLEAALPECRIIC